MCSSSFQSFLQHMKIKLDPMAKNQVADSESAADGSNTHIAECTHLITTDLEIQGRTLPFKVKIAALKSCKIVSLDWLLDSLKQGQPVPVAGYELKSDHLDAIKRRGLESVKRIWQDEFGKDCSSAKAPKIKATVDGFLADLVDEQFPGGEKGLLVWKDHSDLLYDATMFKLERNTSSSKTATGMCSVTLLREQLLWDPHACEYHTWSYKEVDGVISEANRAGLGDLNSAKTAFEKLFQECTGLSWNHRQEKPKTSKYIFVDCHFEDEETYLNNLGPKTPSKGLNGVIDLVYKVPGKSEALIRALVPERGIKPTGLPLSKHQMRVCLVILKQLMAHLDATKKKALTGEIPTAHVQCYQALVNSSRLSTSVEIEWIRDEYEHLSYNRILSLAHQQDLRYPGKLVNIFRIERVEEAERHRKWIQKNNRQRRLLWHGSPVSNFTGILSQGLRGGLGERGIYAAELAGVSTGYCRTQGMCLMLLCEVAIQRARATAAQPRHTPAQYRDAGCIHPDLQGVEMLDIAIGDQYATKGWQIPIEHRMSKPDQIRMRYLFQFTWGVSNSS
ncbi:hypothetical protein N7528_004259 [Penicillium herquei]|nr:hypothetical protein N7528_004259 [Penicillium herquei]